jgi:hypothetical protein
MPKQSKNPTVCVSVPINSYGRKLWKPANENAELFIQLMSERETFNGGDLETIEALGFDVRVIFPGQSTDGKDGADWKVSR